MEDNLRSLKRNTTLAALAIIALILLPSCLLGWMIYQSYYDVKPRDVKAEVVKLREELKQLKREIEIKTIDRIYMSQFKEWRDSFDEKNQTLKVPEVPDLESIEPN